MNSRMLSYAVEIQKINFIRLDSHNKLNFFRKWKKLNILKWKQKSVWLFITLVGLLTWLVVSIVDYVTNTRADWYLRTVCAGTNDFQTTYHVFCANPK